MLNQTGKTFKIDFGEIKHFRQFKTVSKFE